MQHHHVAAAPTHEPCCGTDAALAQANDFYVAIYCICVTTVRPGMGSCSKLNLLLLLLLLGLCFTLLMLWLLDWLCGIRLCCCRLMLLHNEHRHWCSALGGSLADAGQLSKLKRRSYMCWT